jgi:hypothetical protein
MDYVTKQAIINSPSIGNMLWHGFVGFAIGKKLWITTRFNDKILYNYASNDIGIQWAPIDVHACMKQVLNALIKVLGFAFALNT